VAKEPDVTDAEEKMRTMDGSGSHLLQHTIQLRMALKGSSPKWWDLYQSLALEDSG